MGELLDALRAPAGAELHPLPGPDLLERCASLVAARNMIDAELARTVRRAELAQAAESDGLKGMAPWLRGHCRLSPGAAGRLVRAGRTLKALPAVASAAAAGAVTGEQVELLAPIIAPDNRAAADAQHVDHAAVDGLLAGVAATRPHTELAQVVAHYLARLDPDGPEPDPTAGRRLSIAKHADGSTTGRWELDAVASEKVQTALESIVAANRPAGDTRSRSARLQGPDASLRAVGGSRVLRLPFLRTVKAHLLVTIGIGDLVDPGTAPATARANFGALLSAARTRWAACDPDITRILLDPDGLPLDMGRTVRLVPPHLRRAVEHRDQHCVFAGCHAPTYWCEVHHLLEWALDDGETSLENSGLLCERHHTQVHHGFRIQRDANNRWHTYRPDGSEIHVLHPAQHHPPTTRAG